MKYVDDFISINHYQGRAGHIIDAVVVHITDGMDSPMSWFRNPESQVSSNYVVERDGLIRRVVREQDTAWCNGEVRAPDLSNPLIASWVAHGHNPNRRTVSIEMTGKPGVALPAVQWAAVVWLVADICNRNDLPRDRTHVIGHYQINSVDKARCPSLSAAKWKELTMVVEKPYEVGAGIVAAMKRGKEIPASDEQYLKAADGKDCLSVAAGSAGGLYLYLFATDSVYRIQKA